MSKESVTVAGIDCGTNSIRLKIARVDADGMHEVVPRILRVIALVRMWTRPIVLPTKRWDAPMRLLGNSPVRLPSIPSTACVSLPPPPLAMQKTARNSKMRSNVSSACAPKSFPALKKPT